MKDTTEKIIVAVSGGFDPVHVGHLRMFQTAKELGDYLVILLNNDNWLIKKKGHIFMPQEERKEILEGFACVDEVVITSHEENPEDMSVCADLKKLRPHIFANGGDRKKGTIPEDRICKQCNIDMVYNVGGGKVQLSSWLVDKYKK